MCYLIGITNLVVLNQIQIVQGGRDRGTNEVEAVGAWWQHGGGWPVYTRSVVL
jgi:hypothetical protein